MNENRLVKRTIFSKRKKKEKKKKNSVADFCAMACHTQPKIAYTFRKH